VVALVFGAVTALTLSSGAEADAAGAENFEGVCELSGAIRHEPPLTGEPAATEAHGSFSGTCSGELTDRRGHTRQLDGAPVGYRAQAAGELSCLGGTATGRGRLLFGREQEIEFSLTERRPAPGLAVVTLEGAAGGSAEVIGTVSPSDLEEANERCSGSGLRRVRGDARITSLGISG
jgi:hypothetical protein